MKRLKFHLCLITVVVFGTKSFSQPNCGPFYHPSTACAGSTIPVSINPVPGALSYLWIGVFNGVSGTEFGMTITSTPTNTLTISSNQPSGYILWDLRAYSGVSATGNILALCSSGINVSSAQPATPGGISWTGDLCIEQAKTYTCTLVSGATSYTWEVVETGYSEATVRNSIFLAGYWFSSPGLYTLRVKANNACGSSDWRSATITVVSGCPQW